MNAYHGPWLVTTPAEIIRILDALHAHPDDLAKSIVKKCNAALEVDPRFRKPL